MMKNKQGNGSYLLIPLLLCMASPVQAYELNVHKLLEQHYLAKFIEKTEREEDDRPWKTTAEDLQRYRLSERMTALRTRTILLHYLCPECAGKKSKKSKHSTLPLSYHSDVWLDTQVFQTPGKAHIYDAAFPGMTVLGEVYGAYLLVAGATRDIAILDQRQSIIRKIQKSRRGLAVWLRDSLKDMERLLPSGLAIFDRNHPFNSLSKVELFTDEIQTGEWINDIFLENVVESYLGENKETYSKQFNQGMLANNLDGAHASAIAYLPYISAALLLTTGGLNYRFSRGTRSLTMLPWQGCANYLVNGLKSIVGLGGYSQTVVPVVVLLHLMLTTYREHWELKNIKEVLTDELIAIRPFLEKLFHSST